jgi:N-acetylmuramoyl-L-alanine amidase
MAAYNADFLSLPVHNVVIGHTGLGYCNRTRTCIERMLQAQQDNLRREFDDIVANFFVGGDGTIFEGRGANVIGAVVKGWNSKSISIMFIGNYDTDETVESQFAHVTALINQLVKQGVLDRDFVVYGHCQLSHYTIPPGRNVVKHLSELPHWNPAGTKYCLKYA